MAFTICHSHFVHVAFVPILLFQTFDRMIFSTMSFPGTRWYMVTVRDPQMVRDQKKLGTTGLQRCYENNAALAGTTFPAFTIFLSCAFT